MKGCHDGLSFLIRISYGEIKQDYAPNTKYYEADFTVYPSGGKYLDLLRSTRCTSRASN